MRRPSIATRAYWFRRVGKGVAVAASTGAALVSIVSALLSYGVLGRSEAHQSLGNLGAAWVRLRPSVDTAYAVGDTVHFAATIADKNGSILLNARPTWTTGDSTVAVALPDGAVVVRGTGATTVTVVVGQLVATSRLIVKQRVAGVVLSSGAGDTAVAVLEGGRVQLRARAVDARGFTVAQAGAVWRIDDSTVAALDGAGVLEGRAAGHSVVSARIEDKAGYLPIAVLATASQLSLVAGSGQRAAAGRTLPQPIVVRATNSRGLPVSGRTVTFSVMPGVGTVEPEHALTDADGRARATWTLGELPGRQALLARVENLDSVTTIVAEADPVPANTRVAAVRDSLDGPAGFLLADTIAVRVTDSTGRALADVPVQWSAVDGGAVAAVAPRSDSTGIARALWTLGKKTGRQRVRAQVGSGSASVAIPAVTIVADARAGAPADMYIVAGDRQKATVGTTLRRTISIRLVDAQGNGVADIPLRLSLSAGAVPDSAPRTDRGGVATIRWTMGRSAGAHSLAIHVDGLDKLLKVSATATAAAPANLAFEDAPQRGPRTRSRPVFALVTDVYGNPVPDAPVTFTTKTGTVTPARAVTDTRGRALLRWLPGAGAGEHTLTGAVRATDVRGTLVAQGTVSARKASRGEARTTPR